ncbi:phenylacetate--CoA ligase family protein [Cellvibrio japonicus]|nr:phenylacetate--CoA ligase family protein [Cellvibrio japonicus]QEI13641.1 phenylacetate--CoA ligase family protein [Cellvibrio japonicus]QEI17214.1 phenylacetate--CoA ligase family protein [Cellvibrio japonicus]QEI20792.1 phenylacetate--CoA ligase family protein [Cellvibrio japonicus]
MMLKKIDRLLGSLAYRLWDWKEGYVRLNTFNQLRQCEHWPPHQLQQWQEQRLTQLLRHAHKTSDWYKPIIERACLNLNQTITLADLQNLPITTKLDIRDNTDKFISSDYQKTSLVKAKTGGSTGVSLNLFFDRHCQKLRNGAQLYADAFSGWKPGARIAAIWGNPPTPRTLKQKIRAFLLDRMIYLDTMDLNPQSMAAFVTRWRSFQPDMIFGHAHSIYLFAKYLHEQQIIDLNPQGIVATSMMLLDHERQLIEQTFGCKVSNRYGCEEVGLIAVECEQHQGMHINSPHIILECLNEQGQPCAPGETGKLVITDLNNWGMPLIRYRVEDMGVLTHRVCSCGRTTPLLGRLEGRVADFLKKPDGGQVAGVSLVERTLTKIPGVEQMQLVQENLYEIIIHRVKGVEYTSQTDILLMEEFRQVFDDRINLIIRDVEKIPQEKSGKYRFSICKI